MRRLQLAFTFCETEEQAKEKCVYYDSVATAYCRKRYPAQYTPWQSSDPRDTAHFVVWYHY